MASALTISDLDTLDSEATLLAHVHPIGSHGRVAKVKLVIAVLCVVGLGASIVSAIGTQSSTKGPTTSMEDQIEEKELVPVVPSRPGCSKAGENCISTGCCKTSGHTCFMKYDEYAFCNATCQVGKALCSLPPSDNHAMPGFTPGTNMYCFEVYTQNTGTTKKNYELDLIKKQYSIGASIFGCNVHDVFSDAVASYGPGMSTIQVYDELNEFHNVKREKTGAWVNWPLFFQVWKKIRELGRWQPADWTIKVDPDTVFVPARMRVWLQGKKVTNNGVYFENCKNVDSGFFGSTEVISRTGVVGLTDGLEHCHATFAECAKVGCDWKWGPWGEDVFTQRCLDEKHVDKIEAFDLTTDGKCASDRPNGQKKNKDWVPDCSKVTTPASHPFKKPEQYIDCLQAMTAQNP